MPTYKTPDVYIEEISVFPPSVAEVETAIPAFIGYTAKAMKISTDDLRNVPTRVKSLLEFETYFGGAPEISLTNVTIGESNEFVSASFTNSYYLYDALRSFFDNGGGPCYIVSVGSYSDPVDRDELKAGLDAIKRFDEPTILLFPDGAGLAADQLGAVQQHALTQCANLKDRVAVLDTRYDDELGEDFRDNIGINNLKYGAAYTPWLKVNYDKNVSYEDISPVITKGVAGVTLNTLTSDAGILSTITNLQNALADKTAVTAAVNSFLGGDDSISAQFGEVYSNYLSGKSTATIQDVYGYLYTLADLVETLVDGAVNPELETLIRASITSTLQPAFSELIQNEQHLNTNTAGAYTEQWGAGSDPNEPEWLNIFTVAPAAAGPDLTGVFPGPDGPIIDRYIPNIVKNFSIIQGQINAFIDAVTSYLSTYEETLYDIFPIYKNIVLGINNTMSAIPPSGAIAGIYAMVDNQRGVWKAPANVSLSNVIAPVHNFDTDETDGLNVDANAGKSINAIRAFSGKGTLVWGARTLAGNDNEWRYVSVRRFFNMVEESVKKSTNWAVFEPNDANTWVKVRGMIENYLTQKWREGALAGATTKEAFFVRCGLGTTMSAQDILEGRMNVEIGMAVVRPAEFIVLKFSHKLQTS